MKILYIPLDDRPCNYRYPQYLARISGEIEMIVPPAEYMGRHKMPADIHALWSWAFSNISGCDYAVVSVDTLGYGNIINSRIHKKSFSECLESAENFKELKKLNPRVEVHAFNLVTRVSNCNSDEEDPGYWKRYGETIWEYGFLTDKIKRGEEDAGSKEKLSDLRKSVPEKYMSDFLNRREINRSVNLKCLELTADGIIDYLVIPKDDCAEYGYAAADQSVLARRIYEYGIMERVMVYPGADEVGSVLLARVFNKYKKYRPRVYVRYSSVMGPQIIPKYEDRPLHESIKSQVTSIGGIIISDERDADFLLAVNSPGKEMTEASEQKVRNIGSRNFANIDEFIHYIKYFHDEYKKPYGIADVAFANGADDEFMVYANKSGVLGKTCAYGGWNTAQNTVGVVLTQASLCSFYASAGAPAGNKLFNEKASRIFLFRKIIEDWMMQTRMLITLTEKYGGHEGAREEIDPYNVGEHRAEILSLIGKYIGESIKNELSVMLKDHKILIDNISLPWDRIFEIDFDLELQTS